MTRVSVAFNPVLEIPVLQEWAAQADKLGADSIWLAQLPNQRDSGLLLPAIAAVTSTATVGTAILPLYTRPPAVMAQHALTIDELCGGRTVLGLGLGHRGVGEWMVGAGEAPPAVPSMREYFTIVTSLIRDGEVNLDGRWHAAHAMYAAPRRAGLPVYMGAFGPRMMELAGEVADGVLLWMCTPRYVREKAMPALRRGLARRERQPADFPVVVMVNTAVGTRLEKDRELFRRWVEAYMRVPSYQRLFQADGFADAVRQGCVSDVMVAELGVFGTAERLRERIDRFGEAGATSVALVPFGNAHRDGEAFLETITGGLG